MRGSYSRHNPGSPKGARTLSPASAIPAPPPWKAPERLTFMVHAHGPTVRHNKVTGQNRPLVLVRRSDRMTEMVVCRAVEILGPSKLIHRHGSALPETEGNAVAYLETEVAPVCYFDVPTSLGKESDLKELEGVTLTDDEWQKRAQQARHRFY